MGTMNISLPDSLKSFIDEQVSQGGYGTSSEYVRELIRKEAERVHLRRLLLQGGLRLPPRRPKQLISRGCASALNNASNDAKQTARSLGAGQ